MAEQENETLDDKPWQVCVWDHEAERQNGRFGFDTDREAHNFVGMVKALQPHGADIWISFVVVKSERVMCRVYDWICNPKLEGYTS